jgi:hypothetical protein
MAIIDNGEKMSKILKAIPIDVLSENFLNIKPASDFLPDWYRKSKPLVKGAETELNIGKQQTTNSTYKRCVPFFDALSIGYIVFLSCDLEVSRQEDGFPYLMWRTKREVISEHSPSQWEGLPCPDGYSPWVFKWSNFFCLKTPKNYSLLFLTPLNRFDLPFINVSGFVDTDLYNNPVHFPFFIKDDFVGIIPKGTPIAQIIPIKNDSWKIVLEKFNEAKRAVDVENFLSTIKRSYKNNTWRMKKYK